MSWLSAAVSLLAGLLGLEVWEWLPGLTRALIYVITVPLAPDRREIRREEWQGELPHFKEKRLAALGWVLSLLPVCLWEAATAPGTFRRLAIAAPYLLFLAVGIAPFVCATVEVSTWFGLTPLETVAVAIGAPILMPIVLAVGIYGWAHYMFDRWDRQMAERDRR